MSQMAILAGLVKKGWIPLRQMGFLLELPDRSIYGRQRSKNPIPTIRIGGTERVYTDAVREELEAQGRVVLLQVLDTGIRDKERKDAKSIRAT